MKENNPSAVPAELTRRQLLAGAALSIGGFPAGPMHAWSQSAGEVTRANEAIHQVRTIKAPPARVYAVLTDTQQFHALTLLSDDFKGGMPPGSKATTISNEPGGTFTIFGGHIFGRQLELVVGKRIVQAWRVADWPPGVYSVARFELAAEGAGTVVTFDHTGFPHGLGEHLAEGWHGHYWDPMAKYFAR